MQNNLKVVAAACAVVGALGASASHAAFYTFDNGNGDQQWTTPANWSADVVPTADDQVGINGNNGVLSNGTNNATDLFVGFGGSAAALIVQTGSLTSNGPSAGLGFVLIGSGGTGQVVVNNGASFNHTGANDFYVGHAGAGVTGTLTVDAGGTVNNNNVFYIGANEASGVAGVAGTLNAGLLLQGLGAAGSDLVVSGAGIVNASQHFVGWSNNAATANLTIQDTAAVNVTGQMTVGFTAAPGFVSMTGGTLNVNGGAAEPNGNSLYVGRTSSGTFVQSGGTTTINAGATLGLRLADDVAAVGSYTLNGGTLVTPGLSIGAGTGTFTLGGGELQANAAFTSSAPIAITTATNGIVNTAGNDVTLSGAITGAGSAGFFKQGAGTLTLGGANTFGGSTVINGGTLKLGSASALGASTTVFVNSTGAVLDPNGQNVTGPANVVLNAASTSVFNSSATASTISSAVVVNAAGTAIGGVGNIVVNGVATDSAGGFGLNKVGDNTVTLNNAVAFNDTLSVLGGTLLLNGTSTGTGAVSVDSGATLGGTGAVTGSNIVAAGAVSPGAAAGAIGTLTGALAVDLNGSLLVDITGAGLGSADLLAVGGALDIAGATLDLNILETLDDAAYVIATYGGGLTGTFAGVTGLPSGYSVDYDFGGNSIAVVVPEPATVALIGVAALGLLGRRRRTA